MLRVIDYKIIRTFSTMNTLERLVKESIGEGWQPQGAPWRQDNGDWFQAMVLLDHEDSDTEDRHSF